MLQRQDNVLVPAQLVDRNPDVRRALMN